MHSAIKRIVTHDFHEIIEGAKGQKRERPKNMNSNDRHGDDLEATQDKVEEKEGCIFPHLGIDSRDWRQPPCSF